MNAMRGFTKVPTQGIFEGRSVTGTTRVKPKENQNHRGFFHILACLPYDAAEIAMFFWRNLWDEFGFVAKYVGTQGDMMGPHISIIYIYIIYMTCIHCNIVPLNHFSSWVKIPVTGVFYYCSAMNHSYKQKVMGS